MIITDYSMPEMTGYELLKRVKVRKQAANEIHLSEKTIDDLI
jgi:CheY-like chemotaxis protein